MLRIVGDVNGAVGADKRGHFQNAVHHIRDDDFPRAMRPRGEDAQRADRAAAGDEDALPEQRSGAVDGMQRHGEGLSEGGFVD